MADPFSRQIAQQRLLLEMARRQAAERQFAMQQQRLGQSQNLQGAQFQRGLNNDEWNRRARLEEFNQRERQLQMQERLKRDELRRRQNADMEARRRKLKPGFRWKASNPMEQEYIPGGPEFVKARGQHAEDLNKLQSIGSSTDEFVKILDYITDPKNKSGFTSNFGGFNAYLTRMLPNVIPGFAKTGDVSTALERLNEMAEVSGLGQTRGRAGQGVGSITEREWPKFAAQILKLSPRLEEDTARNVLANARQTAMDIRNREMRAYEGEWADTPFVSKNPLAPPQGADAPPAGVAPEDWKYMTPAEKAKWQPTPPR